MVNTRRGRRRKYDRAGGNHNQTTVYRLEDLYSLREQRIPSMQHVLESKSLTERRLRSGSWWHPEHEDIRNEVDN
jgi:hypothetical protein